ncbi:uncharacterized protein PAC_00374 [Phialocephala subalpina]|uniref:NACHT domain-containing protein n=1 Tax=Phialocephala subalpina TaxID=576137 RepID=A0A1L7WCL0_9HELO|nr:uncharacterized protein PAC_00374 [Phialocephala subalpina]
MGNGRLYHSTTGALSENDKTETVTKRLKELAQGLQAPLQSSNTASNEESALKDIAQECLSTARKLIQELEKLKVPNGSKHRRWKSIRQALKSAWSKEKLENVKTRLAELKEDLRTHVLVCMRGQVDILSLRQDQRFGLLENQMQKTIEDLLENHSAFRQEILTHLDGLVPKQSQHQRSREEEEKLRFRVNNRILKSLQFKAMQSRYEAISEAHQRIFEWIFHEQSGNAWESYTQWLDRGEGVYWIQGKSASGKSTLMRFISEDHRSMQCLRTWSGESQLEVVKFYFWSGDVVEQRSQIGLFRSLLHEILSKHKILIQSTFPAEWESVWDQIYHQITSKDGHEGVYLQPLSLFKLRKAFAGVINQARSQFRICFFLDGLDKYDGDHAELALFFNDLSLKKSHLKICLSSRPWPVFDDIFEHAPGLRLQDLTYSDIKLYVVDHLGKNKRMLQLQEEEPVNASEIIEEIVQKACGVFLWAKLVVKSLMDGLANRDGVSRLREILEALPTDLETLYGQMLNSIDTLYRRDASKMFQMSTMTTEIKYKDESTKEVLKRYKHYERLETSLKASCKGLLEVPSTAQAAAVKKAATISFPPITYMHRTVKDYLHRPEVFRKLLAHTAGTEPEPQIALLMTTIVELKERRSEDPSNWHLAMHAIEILERLGLGNNNVRIALAEELDRVMSHHYLHGLNCADAKSLRLPDHTPLHWSKSRKLQNRRMKHEAQGNGLDFLHFAVENNLACYVDAKVTLNSSDMDHGTVSGRIHPEKPFARNTAKPWCKSESVL